MSNWWTDWNEAEWKIQNNIVNMATNNLKIKKGYVLLFKTPKDDYIKDPYVEVSRCCEKSCKST